MRDKYWAKNKYSNIDPIFYEKGRFSGHAGKLIDEIQKSTVVELLEKHLKVYPGNRLEFLDVATGPGRLAFFLERKMKAAKIIGMDINENMLKRARQLAKINKSKVKFVFGDLYGLPFDDGVFDAVVGLRFSMHLPNFSEVLSELSRIIKPGGVLVFDFFNKNSIFRLFIRQSSREIGHYTTAEIKEMGAGKNLLFESSRGILLLGETVLRRSLLPSFLVPSIIKPFCIIEKFSTKMVVMLKKRV